MDQEWKLIFDTYDINSHRFEERPFPITAKQIKEATTRYIKTGSREVRILCKQDTREQRPKIFQEKGLFILPTKNGEYSIIKGEGYFDIPEIIENNMEYHSKLDFELKSSKIGNSEMQHIDYAYATSLIRTFLKDDSLLLTIRGRKYTPKFSFTVNGQEIQVESVQTEVDAGYEGRNTIVLIEAKSAVTKNLIIRQLYYPFRQWKLNTMGNKEVVPILFEKKSDLYNLWQYKFKNEDNYSSIQLVKTGKYKIE